MTMRPDDAPAGGQQRRHLARLLDPKAQAEVDDELAFHLEQRVRDYVARGMTPEAARSAALERFGDFTAVRRDCAQMLEEDRRDARRRDWLGDLRQDLRFGVRSALRAPLFSLLAVVTLALGIGANAAVFGVVKSVLLDALPYADAERLVRVYANRRDGTFDHLTLTVAQIADITERQRSFSRLGTFMPLKQDLAYAAEDRARAVSGMLAGGSFLQTLGVAAALGRTLTDADAAPGSPRGAMLSHAAWQRLFGGDPAVVGREIRLNGVPHTVVGVLPRDFVGPAGAVEVWLAYDFTPHLKDPVRARRRAWLGLVGRLKPGVTPAAAEREIAAIADDLAREHPDADGLVTMTSVPLRDDMAGETRAPLLVLMASAGLVLLITCANLAGALLSRTISRRRELAVRVALGAGRGRLVRQLLTESAVLALAGGAAGLLLATVALAALRGLALPALPAYAELSLDGGAVLVTSALALLTGLLFGVAPALSAGRSQPQGTLREESRGASESRRTGRLRGLLLAGQIALCVSLLAGAGLLVRSLVAMTSAPLGFDPEGVLAVTVQLPPRGYGTAEARARFHQQLEERLRALPGVSGVGIASELPTPVLNHNGFTMEGVTWPADQVPMILYASVSDDYFRTMRIPLLRGRTFGAADQPGAPPTMVISESMARRYWPKGDAVGARIRTGPDPNAPWTTVVGVVGDVRNGPAEREMEPAMYSSIRQDPWGGQIFVLRTSGDPLAQLKGVQRELAAVDPGLPVSDAATVRALIDGGLSGRRLPAVLMAAFGGLALLLASVGVYAMFASMAAAREREFGVRVALGSSRGAIAGLVLRQGALWMALGLAGGALGVVAVARLLGDLLYGVRPFDPLALGVAAAALLACGAVALLVPVRRATRVDPITVLR